MAGVVRRLISEGVPVGSVVVDEVTVGGGVYGALRRELRRVRALGVLTVNEIVETPNSTPGHGTSGGVDSSRDFWALPGNFDEEAYAVYAGGGSRVSTWAMRF